MINGGYYIKARCIQNSEIAYAPPHIREIWDWLLKETNHSDKKLNGRIIERGQCLRSYRDIQEGLHWMVGWRKHAYSKSQCEIAMKWLTKRTMINTRKTTRGLIITICNYDFYQNPKNYESHTEDDKKATRKPQTSDTINKNGKNDKNEIYISEFAAFWNIYPSRHGKKLDKPEALNRFQALKEVDLSLILQAVRNYANSRDVKNGIGIKDPKRFIRDGKKNEPWRDWIVPEKTGPLESLPQAGNALDKIKQYQSELGVAV